MISSIRYLLKNLPLKGRVREGANLKRIFGYYKMSSYFATALIPVSQLLPPKGGSLDMRLKAA